MDKVQYIDRSLRSFWCSLAGLVPVFGLPLAVHSLYTIWKLRRDVQGSWNPARAYHRWGTLLACLGIFISVLTCFTMAAIISNRIETLRPD